MGNESVDPVPDVAAMEALWRDALLAKDKVALRNLIHRDFELVAVRATGPVTVDLDHWLTALDGMDIAAVDMRVIDQVAVAHTMVATIDACWKVRYHGQCIDERVLVTDVWVLEDDRWQVLRRHSSLIPAKAEFARRTQ